MATTTRVPAIEGWFTTDDAAPALLGSRCNTCGTYAFPAEQRFCRNPACDGQDFERVPLSRRGTIWSYTNACYQPPDPYVARDDPYQPFALAAVALEREALVVLGQLEDGVEVGDLHVGQEVELVLGTLFVDDEHEHLIWRWRPVDAAQGGDS